ncbi:MAG: DegT/DnrJ/EryC1/StrS family aminotransferase [Candidatus Portnoybacteria bacterium]|nr:DegT/DnrJ/EryC1/StrS family aminotransferase [Candidatus Portnoybacteria bacterium]MDD4982470.1 DegT/DnrJ/EryC1/StrS family aminotransferase [Candidatus Portnoybacteria bacterium]
MKIEFYKHDISKADIANLNKVLKGVFLTTGETVADFEKKLAQYLGAKYAVGLMSGTAALHLSLAYFGIGSGDEVITTPLTYTATLDAIEYVGAKPVLVDVEAGTGNINADLIESKITKKTKAILPVHLYGQMCDMRKIRSLADKYGLKIIEDSAHCLEGKRDGAAPAQLGDIACFSFYATKNITCGEGGAIATNIADANDWFKQARSHGLSKDVSERYGKTYVHYDKEFLGFKCNMSNIQAALMLDQLKRVDRRLKIREKICQTYDKYFSKIKGITLLGLESDTVSARYLYTILVGKSRRDAIMQQLRLKGINTVVNYSPAHLLSYYRKKYGLKEGDFPVAEDIGLRTITLPLYPKLTKKETEYIIKTVIEIVG